MLLTGVVMLVLRLQFPPSSGPLGLGIWAREDSGHEIAKSNLHLLPKQDVALRFPTCCWRSLFIPD